MYALVIFSALIVLSGTFASSQLNYKVVEEVADNTLIGSIRLDAQLDSYYNETVLEELRYSLLKPPTEIPLSVDEETGIIRIVGGLDRESLCASQLVCKLRLDVVVHPGYESYDIRVVNVNVEVLDINDNSPLFPLEKSYLEISESAPYGSVYPLPAALDPDGGVNGVLSYDLQSNDTFGLKTKEQTRGAQKLWLVLLEHLDREVQTSYEVTLTARDGGNPPKSATLVIKINVTDVDDNDPSFAKSTYEFSVFEDRPPGTEIGQVTASDADIGLNAKIEYSLSVESTDQYGMLFGIRGDTGVIYLKSTLDYEELSVYHLTVLANNQGPKRLPVQAAVIVNLVDVNDNYPVIQVNSLLAGDQIEIFENAPSGTFVAHISVNDADRGEDGNVTCTINSDLFTLQKLYDNQYKIVSATPFDRKQRTDYALILQCMDNGDPPLSSMVGLDVVVLDENDNAPIFSHEVYRVNLTENNNIGDFIVKVTATDEDAGTNSRIEYSVNVQAKSLLNIDPKTGDITANYVFDHERLASYHFTVIATDGGNEPKSAQAVVEMAIQDVDDEKPVFSQPRYSFAIFENQPTGTQIGQVAAMDKDSEPYNRFMFRVQGDEDTMQSFRINNDGVITTLRILDREVQMSYNFKVVAQGDQPDMKSEADVSVTIADQNDNIPVFDYPTYDNYTVYISGTLPVGHVISNVIAHDRDFGINSELTYSLQQGNEEDIFALHPMTGSLIVNKAVVGLKQKSFKLLIRVTDNGKPQYTSIAMLQVVVD